MKNLKALALIGALALTACNDNTAQQTNEPQKPQIPDIQATLIDFQITQCSKGHDKIYLFLDTDGNRNDAEIVVYKPAGEHFTGLVQTAAEAFNQSKANTTKPLSEWAHCPHAIHFVQKSHSR